MKIIILLIIMIIIKIIYIYIYCTHIYYARYISSISYNQLGDKHGPSWPPQWRARRPRLLLQRWQRKRLQHLLDGEGHAACDAGCESCSSIYFQVKVGLIYIYMHMYILIYEYVQYIYIYIYIYIYKVILESCVGLPGNVLTQSRSR